MMKGKKIFTIILALTMVLTAIFAGAESVFAETEENTIEPVNMNSATSASYYTISGYSGSNIMYTEVDMPKAGTLQFNIRSDADTVVGLYNTIDGSEGPISSYNIPMKQDDNDFYIYTQQVPKAGKYFLVFATKGYTPTNSIFAARYIANNGTNVTLKSGKTFYASVPNESFRYYKITTTGTRYLKISIPAGESNDSVYKVKLMDKSKKKNLFKATISLNQEKDFVTYAGVPKGTYYVAVSTKDDYYGINVKASSVSENSGSSKSKAKSILKGGTKSGIITATQSASSGDWYKFKVNSRQLVKFRVDTLSGGSGGIRVYFYNTRQAKAFGSADYYYGSPSGVPNPYDKGYTTLSPGTYYIKVAKYGSGSGYYKLKWL